MDDKDKPTCAYDSCMLPNSNKKFLIQLLYLTISVFFLFMNPSDFSFFAIFMYIFPIMLDLVTSEIKGTIFQVVRWLFVIPNAVAVVFCFLGLGGFFVDGGDMFSIIETSLIFPRQIIEKTQLVVPMILELFVPIVLYFGSPTRKRSRVLAFFKKVKVQS